MFTVIHRKTKEEFTVYGVWTITQQAPVFLLFIEGKFVWKLANDYEPKLELI